MLFKLIKTNETTFFGAGGAKVVELGMMFTAAKRYEFTEIQELAALSGVAVRKVTPADMVALKDKPGPAAYRRFLHIKENYWEVDAERLFIVITREEYMERVTAHERAKAEHEKNWALDSVDQWFESIVGTLTWALDDIKRRHMAFGTARETGHRIGHHATSNMDSVISRIRNMVGNMPLDNVIDITMDLMKVLEEEDFMNLHMRD